MHRLYDIRSLVGEGGDVGSEWGDLHEVGPGSYDIRICLWREEGGGREAIAICPLQSWGDRWACQITWEKGRNIHQHVLCIGLPPAAHLLSPAMQKACIGMDGRAEIETDKRTRCYQL